MYEYIVLAPSGVPAKDFTYSQEQVEDGKKRFCEQMARTSQDKSERESNEFAPTRSSCDCCGDALNPNQRWKQAVYRNCCGVRCAKNRF